MNVKEMSDVSQTLLKGKITELKCELFFLEKGYAVSIPDVPYQYDFIADVNGKLLKIQVKTSRHGKSENTFVFNLCSLTHKSSGYTKRVYNESCVDYFMTEFEGKFYLVPFSECGTRQKILHLSETKNNQKLKVSLAKDFLAENILEI